ncbi:MAG: tyrosine-type recombinase/integrase [Gemmatimonadales bacterium]
MKTKAKLYKAPPPQSVRRRDGTKLSLHVKRNSRGMAEPYRLIDGEPHWRFVYRHGGNGAPTKTFPATDWTHTQRQAVKLAEEFDHPPQPRAVEATPVSKRMSDLVHLFGEHVTGPDARCDVRTARADKRHVARIISPFFVDELSNPAVAAVTPEDVDKWKAKYLPEGELKDRSRQYFVQLLKRLFKLAMDYRWCDWSPVLPKHHVRVAKAGEKNGNREGDQRVGVYLAPTQVESIVAKVTELRPRDPAAPMAVLLAARCGFRREELSHLRREAVELTDDYTVIHVRPIRCQGKCCAKDRLGTWRPKTGAGIRPAVVPPEVVPVLRAYLEERDRQHGKSGWLLPAWPAGRDRNHLEPGGQRLPDWAPDDFKEAAGTGLVFHDTRHTAKTDLLARSGHQAAVDVVIGHRQAGMNAVYSHLEADLPRLYRLIFPDWVASQPAVKLAQKTA